MHLSSDRDSCTRPEVDLFRGLDRHRDLLPAGQRNQPQITEREWTLVHSAIRKGDGIVCAPFSILPLSDRRDTSPQVDHAITDEDIGRRLFIDGREHAELFYYEDAVHREPRDPE